MKANKSAAIAKIALPLATPSTFSPAAVRDIESALNPLLADVFALYIKTKNFHWHMSGPHFRDYHLLLDDQGEQIFNMTDDIAERVRKIGGGTLHSVGHIAKLQRLKDNDAAYVDALDMLTELHQDNLLLVKFLKEAHEVCDKDEDIATASLIESWVD